MQPSPTNLLPATSVRWCHLGLPHSRYIVLLQYSTCDIYLSGNRTASTSQYPIIPPEFIAAVSIEHLSHNFATASLAGAAYHPPTLHAVSSPQAMYAHNCSSATPLS